jgi:hypothetical protein
LHRLAVAVLMQHINSVVWAVVATAGLAVNAWSGESNLTDMETKWLDAADPVLAFAVEQGLPIDVVVQTQNNSGAAPLAVGVQGQRCKLTLSLRNRTDAEATLDGVPAERHALMIEAMAAHEVAHCWRYTHGMWHSLPAGFVPPTSTQSLAQSINNAETATLAARLQQMQATRREEGYADLVALAWIQERHAEDYAAVYSWLAGVREHQPLEGSFHDTRVWLDLARDADFASADSIFEQVNGLWVRGMMSGT